MYVCRLTAQITMLAWNWLENHHLCMKITMLAWNWLGNHHLCMKITMLAWNWLGIGSEITIFA